MPLKFSLRLRLPGGLERIDARELTRVAAEAAAAELKRSLIEGYAPADGAPRKQNRAGRPEGFNTGRLAEGLRITQISGSKTRARTKVRPPRDRAGWVESRGDVMVTDGSVGERILDAAEAYIAETLGS